tara:strand:- start:7276 stop:7701 length:426 start_codon:yes stop_codon:yes gene_type:complete
MNKKIKRSKLLFFLILTNVCSLTLGAYKPEGEINRKPQIKLGPNEAVIKIPAKVFIEGTEEKSLPQTVTIKDKNGKRVFKKARLIEIENKKETTTPVIRVVIKNHELPQNLDQDYFQVIPFQGITKKSPNKKKDQINEIIF